MKFKKRLKQLDKILALDTVPEVSIGYKVTPITKKNIDGSKQMGKFIRKLFDKRSFNLREEFVVVILDNEHQPFGYFSHSLGRMESVNIDNRLLFQKLLVLGAAKFIVAHNHPVAGPQPSEADANLTVSLKHQAEFLDLELVDAFVLSRNGYFSFVDYGMI